MATKILGYALPWLFSRRIHALSSSTKRAELELLLIASFSFLQLYSSFRLSCFGWRCQKCLFLVVVRTRRKLQRIELTFLEFISLVEIIT